MRFVLILTFTLLLGQYGHCHREAPPVKELDDGDFDEEVMNGDHIVNFYAPWCGQCQLLKPTWKKLSIDLKEAYPQVTVAQLDCTLNPQTAKDYRIDGYPTLMYIRRGKIVSKHEGPRTVKGFRRWVDAIVAGKEVAYNYPGLPGDDDEVPKAATPASSSSPSPKGSPKRKARGKAEDPEQILERLLEDVWANFGDLTRILLSRRPYLVLGAAYSAGLLTGVFLALLLTLRERRPAAA